MRAIGIALTVAFLLTSSAPAATVGAGGAVVTPLVTNVGSTATGDITGPGAAYKAIYPVGIADGKAGREWAYNGRNDCYVLDAQPALTAYMQIVMPEAFTAGTIIHAQRYSGAGFVTEGPYTISLDGTVVGSSPGNDSSSDVYIVDRIATPAAATTMRVDFANVPMRPDYVVDDRGHFANYYAGISETLVLPALGEQIPISGAGCDDGGTVNYGHVGPWIVDGSQGQGWIGAPGSVLTINLGDAALTDDAFDIASLFVAAYESSYYGDFSVWASTDGGANYAEILTDVSPTTGDIFVVGLDSPALGVTHLQLRAPGQCGILELMAFAPLPEPQTSLIPEPATLSLLAVGGLAAVLRRRK